jgi:hypothetical protein
MAARVAGDMAAWVAEDMAAWAMGDMAAWVVSATAFLHRPRAWHTRYNRRFRASTRVAVITAHQASAQDTRCKRRWQTRTRAGDITAHQASAQDTRCKRRLPILRPAASIEERRGSLRVDSLPRPSVSNCQLAIAACWQLPSDLPSSSNCVWSTGRGRLSWRPLSFRLVIERRNHARAGDSQPSLCPANVSLPPIQRRVIVCSATLLFFACTVQ